MRWGGWLALTLLCACSGAPEGYVHVGDGIHYRLLELGDGERVPDEADSVLLALRVQRTKGSERPVFEGTHWYAVKDVRTGVLAHPMARMHTGDRAHLLAEGRHVPWRALRAGANGAVDDTVHVGVHVQLLAIAGPSDIAAHRPGEDDLQRGHRIITAHVRGGDAGWRRWGNSMFHYRVEGRASDTAAVRRGDVVTIAYEGRRLVDSVLIDDSRLNDQDFTFRFGDTDQVLEGVEVAVSLLRAGETGRFLIPGEMAFGARGVAGTVGPFEPVLYTVRLLRVERGSVSARQ